MIEYRVGILAIDVILNKEKVGEIKRVKDGWQYHKVNDLNLTPPTLSLISEVKSEIEANLNN